MDAIFDGDEIFRLPSVEIRVHLDWTGDGMDFFFSKLKSSMNVIELPAADDSGSEKVDRFQLQFNSQSILTNSRE